MHLLELTAILIVICFLQKRIGDESVDRRGRETIIYVYQFMDKIESP